MMTETTTIHQAIQKFLASLEQPNSDKTVRAYRTALNAFCKLLQQQNIDPSTAQAASLAIQHIEAFIAYLEPYSPATEKLYLTAARLFYAYLEDESIASPNVGKIQRRIQKRSRKMHWMPEVFPRDGIEKLIVYAQSLSSKSVEQEGARRKQAAAILTARQHARLRNLRDRALILLLADTGLRVAEACSLTYGQVDALEARLRNVQRKGHKRKGTKAGSSVLISERALAAIRDYQEARKSETLPPGMKRKTLPLLIRHDPGAGKELRALTEKSAWEIVKNRAKEVLSPDEVDQIHPHSFRHYFVTVVLLATDLETARRLAGHASADTTARYAEIDPEVEQRYHHLFNAKH